MKIRHAVVLTLCASMVAWRQYVPQPEPEPRSCVMVVEAVSKGDPDPKILQEITAAKDVLGSATTDSAKRRWSAKIAKLEERAEKSRGLILKGVATSGHADRWRAGLSFVVNVPDTPVAVGDFASIGEPRTVRWMNPYNECNQSQQVWSAAKARQIERPKDWPDVRAVPRWWETADERATQNAKLAIIVGDEQVNTIGVRAISPGIPGSNTTYHTDRHYPIRITNSGDKRIVVARMVVEVLDDQEFVHFTERGLMVRDLAPGASVEMKMTGRTSFPVVWQPRLGICYVEFAP